MSKIAKQIACGAAVAIVGLAGQPALAQSQLIETIYKQYQQSGTGTKTPDMYNKGWYSKKILAQIARMNRDCKKQEDICGPGADFLVDAQDYEIKNLKVREISRDGKKANVEAAFTNFGGWRKMTFMMIEENGRWVIDEMIGTSKEQPKGYRLTAILKP